MKKDVLETDICIQLEHLKTKIHLSTQKLTNSKTHNFKTHNQVIHNFKIDSITSNNKKINNDNIIIKFNFFF